MKPTSAIGLAILTLILMCCSVSSQPGRRPGTPVLPDLYAVTVRVQSDLVNVQTYTSTDQPGHVMHSFVEALRTHPKARRIRVSWSMFLGMNYLDSTALYDRRTHSVVFFGEGDGDLGEFRDHVRFTNVSETAFARIAKARQDQDDNHQEDSWGDFDALPLHGCRKHDLDSWHKPPID